MRVAITIAFMLAGVPRLAFDNAPATAKLQIQQFTADSTGFCVNSTLVLGPTEAILFDTQYLVKDARRIADAIAASGKHLKAIVLTHPDDDHYYGVATILQRFPGTPVYMSVTGISEFTKRELPQFQAMKARIAAMPPQAGRTPPPVPDSLVTPTPFPGPTLSIDGEEIQIISDVQGDVLVPSNSMFWIPSINTLITGDVVFNGVHVWLAASDDASRERWRAVLARAAELQPAVVIAGHKSRVDAPDSPAAITATAKYLADFSAARKTSTTADELVAKMDQQHPDLAVHLILVYAARNAFKP